MKQQATYTLGQAATLTGRSKSSLHRDIKNGLFSAVKLPTGSYQIDAAELHRAYSDLITEHTRNSTVGNHETPQETNAVHLEIKFLREQMEKQDAAHERERVILQNRIDDLATERDDWKRQATALLTHKPAEASATPTPTPAKADAWRLFGLLAVFLAALLIMAARQMGAF